jgi:hypothetical protein
LRGDNRANKGDIGAGAVDLSYNDSGSATRGATGSYSYAEGESVTASGDWSHAEGIGTTSSERFCHAEGNNSTASGIASHAEGSYTISSGQASHAEGGLTIAGGYASHAEGGYNTILSTAPKGAHAEGYYCIDVTTGQQSVIGIGSEVLGQKNGRIMWTDGTVTLPECTNALIDSRGAKAVTTKEYTDSKYVSNQSLGYATGAGGTVTQTTSRTTGVTINKLCGSITLVSAAGSTTVQSFTVSNSLVSATDTVVIVQKSGTDIYLDLSVTAVANGSFRVTFRTTGGTTTEQPVFNFSVIKAVTA